ncbi:MAG: hypothetical protein SRB1_02021 [Desulfobacteraceae bacterium Eth-SRB1]|nr:MAG: hypothetical protein SRB1_02021 [Desulfobacteraceae bacterium Eth-SRB1]
MRINSLFKPRNYRNKIKSIKKSITIGKLVKIDFPVVNLTNIWVIDNHRSLRRFPVDVSNYKIFGKSVDLKNINWHKDYVSGFEYPQKRFGKLKISKWFDKGIDVKFPWELSRFYFAICLAQNYQTNTDNQSYDEFRRLVIDWIDKNPFCYGVNWNCTMEVAIRAINWIVAANIFGQMLSKNCDFVNVLSNSLVQHAEYISAFPEIYEVSHTTNHTTADYTGLLFLSLALKNNPKAEKWINQAIEGLESCIRYQTYEDGVNFEASIPYHRLVLEMFAYSAVACKSNDIELSKKYYELLFKMFEYSAAYMDHNGNAPQVGDNDSGRILIFHESYEHDHSYLLDLGECIFDYKFKSQCTKRNHVFSQWLPKIQKICIDKLNVKPRETGKSIAFEKGGAYFLKNEKFSLMVACFPIGQNGVGGHNHYDTGSITLSYRGQPVVVDPGTYTYTRDYKKRELFRSPQLHNCIIGRDKEDENSIFIIWGMDKKHECNIIVFSDNKIELCISDLILKQKMKRTFILNQECIYIEDSAASAFLSYIHLSPDLNPIINEKQVLLSEHLYLVAANCGDVKKEDYLYSENYDRFKKSEFILIESNYNNQSKTEIKFL